MASIELHDTPAVNEHLSSLVKEAMHLLEQHTQERLETSSARKLAKDIYTLFHEYPCVNGASDQFLQHFHETLRHKITNIISGLCWDLESYTPDRDQLIATALNKTNERLQDCLNPSSLLLQKGTLSTLLEKLGGSGIANAKAFLYTFDWQGGLEDIELPIHLIRLLIETCAMRAGDRYTLLKTPYNERLVTLGCRKRGEVFYFTVEDMSGVLSEEQRTQEMKHLQILAEQHGIKVVQQNTEQGTRSILVVPHAD